MLLQGNKNAFLRKTANKHRVINVTLPKLMKAGCNAFHSYDDAAICTTKLSVQSFLKFLVTKISETKDLPVLSLQHAGHNSKPLYFKDNKK